MSDSLSQARKANGTSSSGSSNGNEALKYQGRKTSRATSEQRRRIILEAALRIVVRDGVRGVRHRAVAKEADVPLSATTYYFKDISDLITDTFTLFVEMGAEKFKAFWEESDTKLQEALALLDGQHPACLSQEVRQVFVGKMVDLAVHYIVAQLKDHRDYLIAERSFQLECLRNENLRPVAFNHQSYLLNSLESFFGRVGSEQPAIDAQLFAAVIMQVEYQSMVQSGDELDTDMIRDRLVRQISLMLK
ncbi:TetR family transcriptional regulator [Endozoicomonas montiporae]|uniref:TetR family transcriptional regulator n=1 Tax=Endozoicomonas montiporae TaxID=1027273 RepID=A0A081NAD2_9GAMM|nr:TetR family transcriptional regulator [Endozoicomonas montiporae]